MKIGSLVIFLFANFILFASLPEETCGQEEKKWNWTIGEGFRCKIDDEVFVKLEELPEGIQLPAWISHDAGRQLLVFKGIMKEEERDELLKRAPDDPYQKAVKRLFLSSQTNNFLRIFPRFKTEFKYIDNIFGEHLNERGELTYTESPGLKLTLNKLLYSGKEKDTIFTFTLDYLVDIVRNQSFNINNDENQHFTSKLDFEGVPVVGLSKPIDVSVENIFEDLFDFGDAPDIRGPQWFSNETKVAFDGIKPFPSGDKDYFNIGYRRFREDFRRAEQERDRTDNTVQVEFFHELFKREIIATKAYLFNALVDYTFTDVDYDTFDSRDGHVHIIRGGFKGDLTSKIEMDLRAGYETREFDTSTSPDFKGSHVNASLTYFFFPKFHKFRKNSDKRGISTDKRDDYQLQFQFKRDTKPSAGTFFRRNNAVLSTAFTWKYEKGEENPDAPEENDKLVATFKYGYENSRTPRQTTGNAGERKIPKKFIHSFTLGLDYKLAEYSNVNFKYNFTDQDSNFDINDPFDYEANAVTAFVQFSF